MAAFICLRCLADEGRHLAHDGGICQHGGSGEDDLLLGHIAGQDRAVPVDDLPAWSGHAHDPDLIAGHRGRIGLAVDDLQGPQAQHEDEEESDHDASDHPQANVGTGRFVLGRPHQRGHIDTLAGTHAGLTGIGPPGRKSRAGATAVWGGDGRHGSGDEACASFSVPHRWAWGQRSWPAIANSLPSLFSCAAGHGGQHVSSSMPAPVGRPLFTRVASPDECA